MNSNGSSTLDRAPFHGLGQIIRFNWPFYAVATTIVAITLPALHRLPLGALAHAALYAAAGLAALWLAGSLAASWIVYDRSPLMKGTWIREALGFRPSSWINVHAGLDETTPLLLRTVFSGSLRARLRHLRPTGDDRAVDRPRPAGAG